MSAQLLKIATEQQWILGDFSQETMESTICYKYTLNHTLYPAKIAFQIWRKEINQFHLNKSCDNVLSIDLHC